MLGLFAKLEYSLPNLIVSSLMNESEAPHHLISVVVVRRPGAARLCVLHRAAAHDDNALRVCACACASGKKTRCLKALLTALKADAGSQVIFPVRCYAVE